MGGSVLFRRTDNDEGVPPVPGENLSRDEARERAALLSVDGVRDGVQR